MSTEKNLVEFFMGDHRACDAGWADLENALDAGQTADVGAKWQAFQGQMLRHLAMEEQVLFPAFEAATGMTSGPTQVMRMEHDQMRGVLAQMATAVEGGDFQNVLDLGDTLLMLIQQHNQKEEGVLYPMAGQHLADQWTALYERTQQVEI